MHERPNPDRALTFALYRVMPRRHLQEWDPPLKRQTIAGTITLLAIAVLAVAGGLSAPSVSASSLISRQEIRQQQQQSGEPVLTSMTVTASGTAQPLSPAFGSTVKYDTVVVSAAVTQITVAGASAAGDSVEADTAALMALYTSAGGVNWRTKTNWGIDVPIGMWSGVTTDSNGRVTKLDLRSNNLVGTLPDELGDFTGMQEIYLQDNELTGPIPDLSGLTSLTHLEMARNQLSGPIPALGALTPAAHLPARQRWVDPGPERPHLPDAHGSTCKTTS